jgi:hypothetical protein
MILLILVIYFELRSISIPKSDTSCAISIQCYFHLYSLTSLGTCGCVWSMAVMKGNRLWRLAMADEEHAVYTRRNHYHVNILISRESWWTKPRPLVIIQTGEQRTRAMIARRWSGRHRRHTVARKLRSRWSTKRGHRWISNISSCHVSSTSWRRCLTRTLLDFLVSISSTIRRDIQVFLMLQYSFG